MPLKNLVLLDESMKAFFWYKGYIPRRDLITEYIRGISRSDVVVRNNRCLAWVQKCTVIKLGNGDQEIPAEPVETCSFGTPSRSRQQVMVESDVRDKVGSVASLPAPIPSNMAKKDMDCLKNWPDHGPKSHCLASAAITQPNIPASYVANDNGRHQPNPDTHRQGRFQSLLTTRARPGNAVSEIRAPDRKVMFSNALDMPLLITLRSECSVQTPHSSFDQEKDCRDREGRLFDIM